MTDPNRREALQMMTMGLTGLAARRARAAPDAGARSGPITTRPIGTSGASIPIIGLGTSQTFDVGKGDAERAPLGEVLRVFVELGGKLVDTSPMYGTAETVIGDLCAKLNLAPKLFFATKVWTTGKRAGIAQMQESMRRLRVPRLDLIQVHNLLDLETQLETLQAWKRESKLRYVGISHYTASHHDQVAAVLASRPVDFVQINYSVAEREAERRVLPLAKERGVAVIANRPFARGEILRGLRDKPLPKWAAEIDCQSWAQLLLKFVVSHPAITCAIPATSKAEHMRDNMSAAYGRMPDEKLRAKIAASI